MNELIEKNIHDYDVDLFTTKGLFEDGKLNEKYYMLFKNYKILLDRYLFTRLPLKDLDNSMINSGLLFKPTRSQDMDFYQIMSSMGLKYVYLRNHLYVEKLSLADIDVLLRLTQDELLSPNEEIIKLIERTYRDVIDSNFEGPEITVLNCYGKNTKQHWKDSKELVFGVRYDEYADNGLGENEAWEKNNYAQMAFMKKLLKEKEEECSKILKIPVSFLKYNEYTYKTSIIK